MKEIWEDMISLNSRAQLGGETLGPVSQYLDLDDGSVTWDRDRLPLENAIARDTAVLPMVEHREGYYGPNHFTYWASGLRDYFQILDWTEKHGVNFSRVLDIGCATGRFLRHIGFQTNVKAIYGCDINRLHVDWISRNLPASILAFQNTSVPTLPLEPASVDLVTAFSVFTHIESFDTAWLMEIRRILKPGGIAWLTIHGDRTWRELLPDWPAYNPVTSHPDYKASEEIPDDRLVLRWQAEKSYSANVYYKYSYIRHVWGRFLQVADIFPALPHYQDVVVLRR